MTPIHILELPDTLVFNLRTPDITSFIAKSVNPWERRGRDYSDNPLCNSLSYGRCYSFSQWERDGRPADKQPPWLKETGVIIYSNDFFIPNVIYDFLEDYWGDYVKLMYAKGLWEVTDLQNKEMTLVNKRPYLKPKPPWKQYRSSAPTLS